MSFSFNICCPQLLEIFSISYSQESSGGLEIIGVKMQWYHIYGVYLCWMSYKLLHISAHTSVHIRADPLYSAVWAWYSRVTAVHQSCLLLSPPKLLFHCFNNPYFFLSSLYYLTVHQNPTPPASGCRFVKHPLFFLSWYFTLIGSAVLELWDKW